MTKDNLAKATMLSEQIETLNTFLEDTRKCWGKLKFFVTPKRQNVQVTLKTSYGWLDNEISASERLSASIVEAIKNEVALLQSELDSL